MEGIIPVGLSKIEGGGHLGLKIQVESGFTRASFIPQSDAERTVLELLLKGLSSLNKLDLVPEVMAAPAADIQVNNEQPIIGKIDKSHEVSEQKLF